MANPMAATVALITQDLTTDELVALNMVAQLDDNPHDRLFDYQKVKMLFTEANGTRMHAETKRALLAVVLQRTRK